MLKFTLKSLYFLKMSIEETFKHVNRYWLESYYETCQEDWDKVKEFISKTKTNFQCGKCDTYWLNNKFVYQDTICPMCDQISQPFLCNPINYQSVLKYIDNKYHKYLLPDNLNYCVKCYTLDIDNSCHFCDIKYFDRCVKIGIKSGSSHDCGL